ncbi:MAG: hypothetical protein MUF45_09620 [Spirosomaceae bacterium]|jgi:hypothetical protein|nr:hypothetical protein [Spirosomataceae bacterium]
MTLKIELKQDFALSVLQGLAKIGAIRIVEEKHKSVEKKQYKAASFSLNSYRFNREEANER